MGELIVIRHGTYYAGGADPETLCPECNVSTKPMRNISEANDGNAVLNYNCRNCGAIFIQKTDRKINVK